MESLTSTESFVLNAMKRRKHRKQAINKIAIETKMEKEDLRKVLKSLKAKGYLYNEKGKDGALKWVMKRV